jgi:hypothetical protein
MTDHAVKLMTLQKETMQAGIANGSLRRMVVNSVETDGTLTLREVGTDVVHDEPYLALASPSPYAAEDYVIVGEVMGRGSRGSSTRVVIGKPTNNSPVTLADAKSQATADTPNTSSISTYADAVVLSLVLAAGTWSVTAHGGLLLSHNVSQASWRIEIDGNAPSAHTLALVTEQKVNAAHSVTGIAGGRTITVKVQYRSFTAGTSTARNPSVMVTAIRTG